MAWYRTGTVTVTNNSDIINGVGTDWISAAKEGETFLGPDNLPYEIAQLVSATQLRIRPAFRGNTSAGQSYAIMPTQSYMRDLSAQVSQLINNYSGVRDNAGTGKFAAAQAAQKRSRSRYRSRYAFDYFVSHLIKQFVSKINCLCSEFTRNS